MATVAAAVSTPKRSALARSANNYWSQTRRPLVCLAFIAPLLACYESGVVWLGPQAVRNGADVWLRQLLDWIGLAHYSLLPILTAALLVGWHYRSKQRWHVSRSVLSLMLLECAVLSLVLVAIAQVQGALFQMLVPADLHGAPLIALSDSASSIGRLIGFFGAGIYEEVLFRLMLLPAAWLALRGLGAPPRVAIVAAMVITSLAFAGAHYIGPSGEPLELFSFVFRTLAGGFFAVLFVYRGFGIAAGVHAGYDILAGLLLAA